MKSRIGIYIIIFVGIIISIQLACKKKVTEEVPSLVTINVTDITSTSITTGGLVFSSGGDSVSSRGICLSTEPSPEITDIKTNNGAGTGSFTSTVSGLMPGTNYYLRAYATNGVGTGYGNQFAITTKGELLSLTTAAISSLTSTTAVSGGNITGDAASSITSRGVCWSIKPVPTITDSKTSDGSGLGTFSSSLSGLALGTTYYVRAYATNSTGTIYGNELTFKTVCDLPAAPTVINGNTTIDQNAAGIVYSITAVPGATVYNWKVPSGATIVSGQGTTSITVNFGTTGGDISVSAGNSCGNSAFSNLAVSTCPVPAAPGPITGNPNIAPNATGVVFSIAPVNGATKYNWRVPAGATIILGQGTTAITVDFGNTGGNVSVQTESNCGSSSYTDLLITICLIPPAPGTITGTTTINQFAAGIGYSIPAVTGATNYTWTVPSGAIIVSGQGTLGILINFGSTGGTISVRSENSCGKSLFTSIEVAMCYLPAAPEVVNGPSEVIPNATGISYSTTAVPWTTDYTWMVPPGATIVSNQGTTTIIVNFGTSSGNVSVRAENNCGISPYTSMIITVRANLPSVATNEVIPITTATASGGGNITSDGGSAIIARGVCWSTSPTPTTANSTTSDGPGSGSFSSYLTGLTTGITYYVRAYATNSAGTSYGNEISFTTPCTLPEMPWTIKGSTSVTFSETGVEYSIAPVTAATSYTWTVPPDASIISGQGTTTITVNFGRKNGDVSVRAENNCGNSAYINLKICVLDSFTDSRDSRTYKIAQIGTQVWMAENLAYLPEVNPPSDGSFTLPYYYVYDYYGTDLIAAGATGNFKTYGVLYNWPAAMAGFATSSSNPSGVRGICPAGWHLPSDDEWTTLTTYLGGDGAAGSKLKETGTVHWFAPNVGATNETCFSALPGGYRFDSGLFWNYGEYGWWWSSTEGTAQAAAMRNLLSGTGTVGNGNYSKSNGLAVRCVSGESVVIPTAPVLITTSATMITETSLSSGGTITSDGGAPITLKGVCWSTAPGPTTADIVTLDGTGSGIFTSIISLLTPGTTYYVRAYATNSAGTSYGNEITFTTVAANLPSITTLDIICSSITSTTASTGGNIIFAGGFPVTSSGVCWSTSPGPTTAGNKTTDGAAVGIFASTIDGLSPGTTFFVRAYATNGAGTSYGNEVTFTSAQSSYPGCGSVYDIDGNVYNTVIIGTQCWMKENLKTTRYSNSDPIANVIDGTEWWALSTGAYCWYNNDAVTYKDSYGALYNWYAAADSRNVCPVGWHSATDADWTTLTTVLGGDGSAGGPMKETCLTHWIGLNAGATNTSGFTALPGGYRPGTGAFNSLGYLGYWWTSTEDSGWAGWYRAINYNNINVIRIFDRKEFGFSVRCVKDN